jgi:hypothetical protein
VIDRVIDRIEDALRQKTERIPSEQSFVELGRLL